MSNKYDDELDKMRITIRKTTPPQTLPVEVEALQREADRSFYHWVKLEKAAEAAHGEWEKAERAATAALNRLA